MIVGDADDQARLGGGEHRTHLAESGVERLHVLGVGLVAIPEDPRIVGRGDHRDDLSHDSIFERELHRFAAIAPTIHPALEQLQALHDENADRGEHADDDEIGRHAEAVAVDR